ncbi:MAG: sigma-70 family RNA polymerase sigma factor [Acidobacteriota bacterium]
MSSIQAAAEPSTEAESSTYASPGEVTNLLQAWRAGDRGALKKLFPIVYDELQDVARRCLRNERPGHVLQTTALVHEAYLRLTGADLNWRDRDHFFAIATRLMRRVLVELAREQKALKRGGGAFTMQLDDDVMGQQPAAEVLELHEALRHMRSIHPRESRVLELRFFGGLKIAEAARVLGVSPTTIERDQRFACAWLARELNRRGNDDAAKR